MLVSGCSDFSCGLCRLVNTIRPSVGMIEGSRYALRRVTRVGPRTVVLSPNPKEPRSTNVYVPIVGRFTKGVPVLNIYLKRRSVYRTFKKAISCTGRLVRKGGGLVCGAKRDQLFGSLPSAFTTTECRSLTTLGSALPTRLEIATRSRSKRIVTIRRAGCLIFKMRFRPRSMVAPSNEIVVRGFVRMIEGSWKDRCWVVGRAKFDLYKDEDYGKQSCRQSNGAYASIYLSCYVDFGEESG